MVCSVVPVMRTCRSLHADFHSSETLALNASLHQRCTRSGNLSSNRKGSFGSLSENNPDNLRTKAKSRHRACKERARNDREEIVRLKMVPTHIWAFQAKLNTTILQLIMWQLDLVSCTVNQVLQLAGLQTAAILEQANVLLYLPYRVVRVRCCPG